MMRFDNKEFFFDEKTEKMNNIDLYHFVDMCAGNRIGYICGVVETETRNYYVMVANITDKAEGLFNDFLQDKKDGTWSVDTENDLLAIVVDTFDLPC